MDNINSPQELKELIAVIAKLEEENSKLKEELKIFQGFAMPLVDLFAESSMGFTTTLLKQFHLLPRVRDSVVLPISKRFSNAEGSVISRNTLYMNLLFKSFDIYVKDILVDKTNNSIPSYKYSQQEMLDTFDKAIQQMRNSSDKESISLFQKIGILDEKGNLSPLFGGTKSNE